MRAVQADHVRFSEAIDLYARGNGQWSGPGDVDRAYVLAPLALQSVFTTSRFVVQPAQALPLPGGRSAFVLPVDLPHKVDSSTAHLMAHVVAALLSVAFVRGFNAPRDPYHLMTPGPLTLDQMSTLALEHNVLTAGPGFQNPNITSAAETGYATRVRALVDGLERLDTKAEILVLQAIRLQQLGLLTKRMDFELGFSLLVASVEAMSQMAIKVGNLETDDIPYSPVELKLKAMCGDDPDMSHWFKQKVVTQGSLTKRFVLYVLKHAPSSEWHKSVPHPLAEVMDYVDEATGRDSSWVTTKSGGEIYPEELSQKQVNMILRDTYNDRSGFVHAGTRTTHSRPNTDNRFFDEADVYSFDTRRTKKSVALRFETLGAVATASLLNYLGS